MRKIAIYAGLAAVLMLSACTKSEDIKVTETLTEQLTEETTALSEAVTEGQLTEVTTTVPNTEETTAETTSGEENAESYVIPEGMTVIDLNASAEGSSQRFCWPAKNMDKDIVCMRYSGSDGNVTVHTLKFVEISTGRTVGSAEIPSEWDFDRFINGSGFPVKVLLDRFNRETNKLESAVLTVYEDYSTDIAEADGYTTAFDYCGHKISEFGYNILDADRELAKIVKGVPARSDGDFEAENRAFSLPLDENRFVYRKIGYERVPGFGIYDFETDTATDVPDSDNLLPLGIHGGKIYSYYSWWDGFPEGLYITDTETLETTLFTEMPVDFEGNNYGTYYMPESGDRIALVKPPCYESMDSEIYVIDPDTAEVSHKYTIPAEVGGMTSFFFSGNDNFCASDGEKLVIMNLES